jgi:hypothetical protein
MKRLSVLIAAFCLPPLCCLAAPAPTKPVALELEVAPQASVPRYGKFELTLKLEADYENPFDPDQIDLRALFTTPAGRTVTVNGFLDQPFTRRLEGGTEIIEPAGEPVWRVRFAPDAIGLWRYQVLAKTPASDAQLAERTFHVTPSDSPGFIRVSERNPRGFAYDDGSPFFAVGENMGWGGGRGSFDYDDWLMELGKAGGNWIRIWMSSWNCALEWSQHAKGDWRSGQYHGVGRYSLGNAWKLDTILDTAERHGISVMVCFGTYGEFTEGGFFNEGQWQANPYNAANGGPCEKPDDFWTSEEARKLYQRRLRYIMARYSHRTSIHSWEFWNEARAPAVWVGEMASFMKGTGEFRGNPADPHKHLLSTTYGNPEVWRIPEIDFTQSHPYGKGDISDFAPRAHSDAREHAVYGKPHLMAEFGIDWRAPDTKYDPAGLGVNLHNAMWASAFSGNAGGAMIWWWDSYIHPSNLYWRFTPLRRFADTVPWAEGEWKVIETDASRVNVYGLVQDRTAILWVQNPAHHWKNIFEKNPISPVPAHEITLGGLPAGRYAIEWWDTQRGEITDRDTAESVGKRLRLALPELPADAAARLLPLDRGSP